MTNEDIVQYVTNVVLISAVDGVLSPTEAKAIESICEEIGASENDLDKAVRAVREGDHQIKPVGRFSDRVRNLEDMIFISISDGEISKSEKPEILSFAKAIKLTQEQLKEILSEARLRVKLATVSLKCPSCGNENPPGSKFCSRCGSRVQVG